MNTNYYKNKILRYSKFEKYPIITLYFTGIIKKIFFKTYYNFVVCELLKKIYNT